MDPFLGEIRMFGGNFAPRGWALCQGQILAISSNTALFSLLGVQYGGNGTSTFALPNLTSRVPLGVGTGPGIGTANQGEVGGEASHTLTSAELPSHTHSLNGDNFNAGTSAPGGNMIGKGQNRTDFLYAVPATLTTMATNAVNVSGSGQPHENQQPYLVLNYIIATQGVFPQRP